MEDGFRCAVQTLDRAVNQMLARLGEHLNGDVIRQMAVLDQLAKEIIVGV